MKRKYLTWVGGHGALILLVLAICVLTFFPFYWILIMSFQPRDNVFAYPPAFWPRVLQLTNYVAVFAQRPILRWLTNTAIVSLSSTALAVVVSTFGAYSLARFRYRGRNLVTFLLLISQMLPITLLMIPIYMLFRQLHFLDKLPGLAIAYTTITLPLCVWMLKGYFESVPVEIEEAAMVDGCSRIGALFRVVLPVSLPGLAAVTGFSIVSTWNEYGLALALINSDKLRVMSVGLANFLGSEYGTSYEQIAAAAVVMVLPEVILFVLLQRYLIHGLTAGAVKG